MTNLAPEIYPKNGLFVPLYPIYLDPPDALIVVFVVVVYTLVPLTKNYSLPPLIETAK